MKSMLAIATMAFFFAAGHPMAATTETPLAQQNAPRVWDGKWQGTTVSGQALVLEIKMEGQRMTGRLVVGKQSAKITAGKVVGDGFALTTAAIDGQSVGATGRHMGEAIELTIDG